MTYRGRVRNAQSTLDQPAHLPEGAPVSVNVIEEGASTSHPTRLDILRMPVGHRRELLTRQSERAAEHYKSEDRSEWQGGEIVE